MDLFWLEPQMEQLRQAQAAGRLPHALLIHDVPGGGGYQLALYAAQTALCRQPHAPCGQCRDCQQVMALTNGDASSTHHPDLHLLEPIESGEKASVHISIAQVRALGEELSKTSHRAGASVAILHPADMLLPPASNALLKTLEEPRPGVLIVLLTASPSVLLATLRSRCMRMRVKVPPRTELIAWLQHHHGAADWQSVLEVLGDAPLLAAAVDAKQLAELRRDTHAALVQLPRGDAQALAELATQWSRKDQFLLRLACIESWITLRIGLLTGKSADAVALPGQAHLPAATAAVNIAGLVRAYDAARDLNRLATTPLNKSLALELLFWQLSRQTGH